MKILGVKDNIGKWFSNDDNKYYIERKSDKAKCYLVNLSNGFVRAHCTSLVTFLKAGNFSKYNLKKTTSFMYEIYLPNIQFSPSCRRSCKIMGNGFVLATGYAKPGNLEFL